jgi:hypothetical protein
MNRRFAFFCVCPFGDWRGPASLTASRRAPRTGFWSLSVNEISMPCLSALPIADFGPFGGRQCAF